MKKWTRWISYLTSIRVSKHDSELNGPLFVNIEEGKKVLHSQNANYSFLNLHTVFRKAIGSVIHDVTAGGRVLNLGMGAGSTVYILRHEFDFNGEIISVEHDPKIIEIAKNEFDIDQYSNHQIVEADAYDFMGNLDQKFDLILCDLFKDKNVPEKFKTQAFFDRLLQSLQPNGMLIFNYVQLEQSADFFKSLIANQSREVTYEIQRHIGENRVLVLRVNGHTNYDSK